MRVYIRITSWQHWYSNLESWICNDLWDLYDAACNRRWCQLEYKRRFQMPWKYSEFNQNETFDFHFRREFTKPADVEQERLRPNRSQVPDLAGNSQKVVLIPDIRSFGYTSNDLVKDQYNNCMMKGKYEEICKKICSEIAIIDHGSDNESGNRCDTCRGKFQIHFYRGLHI